MIDLDRIRQEWREITASDGGECQTMKDWREMADEIERLARENARISADAEQINTALGEVVAERNEARERWTDIAIVLSTARDNIASLTNGYPDLFPRHAFQGTLDLLIETVGTCGHLPTFGGEQSTPGLIHVGRDGEAHAGKRAECTVCMMWAQVEQERNGNGA